MHETEKVMRIKQFVTIGIGLTFVINGIVCISRPEDAVLSVPQLIEKYGHQPEIHHVTTTDGYILELHRITTPTSRKHPPIFLQHGISSSSDCWVLLGPEIALGYLLSNQGFDVWLGNGRGNRYSRNHTTLNLNAPMDSTRFWDFTLQELGVYDLPACMDYILQETNQTQIYYVGHSQGCSQLLVLLAENPSYNKKIKAFFALSPSAYRSNSKSALFRAELFFDRIFQFATLEERIGSFELFPRPNKVYDVAALFCSNIIAARSVCSMVFHLTFGYSDQLDPLLIPVILGHSPTGTSSKQRTHVNQLARSNTFSKYDYGKNRNALMYNQSSPPKYNLKLVTVPTYVYYGRTDALIDPKDAERLIRELPNVKQAVLLGYPNFSHTDFIYGSKAKEYLYDLIMEVLNTLEAR